MYICRSVPMRMQVREKTQVEDLRWRSTSMHRQRDRIEFFSRAHCPFLRIGRTLVNIALAVFPHTWIDYSCSLGYFETPHALTELEQQTLTRVCMIYLRAPLQPPRAILHVKRLARYRREDALGTFTWRRRRRCFDSHIASMWSIS